MLKITDEIYELLWYLCSDNTNSGDYYNPRSIRNLSMMLKKDDEDIKPLLEELERNNYIFVAKGYYYPTYVGYGEFEIEEIKRRK